MTNKFILSFLLGVSYATGNLEGIDTGSSISSAEATDKIQTLTGSVDDQLNLSESQKAANQFLEDLDTEHYGESWEAASLYFQKTMPKEEWVTAMELMRKPLGELKTRKLGDQRAVKDPANHPKGEYMVMFYRSSFEKNNDSYELLTLIKDEGQWKVFTYNVY